MTRPGLEKSRCALAWILLTEYWRDDDREEADLLDLSATELFFNLSATASRILLKAEGEKGPTEPKGTKKGYVPSRGEI